MICLKLQFSQCNNELLTAVQSSASAGHSDQTQITRSSHRGRASSGTDSIEWPDRRFWIVQTWVTRDFSLIAFFCKWYKVSRPSSAYSPCGHVSRWKIWGASLLDYSVTYCSKLSSTLYAIELTPL